MPKAGEFNGWTHNHYRWFHRDRGTEIPTPLPYYKIRDKAKAMNRKGYSPGLVVEGRPDPKNPKVIIYNNTPEIVA